MGKATVKDIQNRYNIASHGNQAFYSLYKRAYEMSSPNANNVDKGANQGNLTSLGVLDSTTARATDNFVNTLITTIFPPQTRWMELEPSDQLIQAIAEINNITEEDSKEQLTAAYQKITDIFFDALNQSNFYSVTDQFSRDIFIGTGVLLVQKSNDLFDSASPLDFTAIPPLDVSVEVTGGQKITAVFRKSDMKYSEIQYIWPEFDMSVVKNKPEDAEGYNTTKSMIEACILEPIYVKTPTGKEIYKRWRYVVICDDSIGFETYYKTNPFIVFFWNLLHGENVGRGLMTKLMPDALELEAMVDLKNRWMQMYGLGIHSIMPSKMYNASTAKIRPNAVMYVKEQGAIQPINPAGSPQIQQLGIAELRQSIKETALDFGVPNDPNMTATQVQLIAQRQLQIFAGVVGRIQFQLLWPIVQNCLDILIEGGFIQLPAGLSKIDSNTTKLKILSPIGRVQNLNDLNSLMSALSYIAQIDPQLIPLYVKTEELPTWIFQQTGSPAKFLRSEDETNQVKAQIQQAQEAQMMLEQGAA